MTLNAKALEACPFCGGEASLRDGGPGCFFVQCDMCSATSNDGSQDRAVARWNSRTALSSLPQAGVSEEAAPAALGYTNYRGETSVRRLTPMFLWHGSTRWHPEGQWMIHAYDHDKKAERDFALKDFGPPVPADAGEPGIKAAYERGRADAYVEAAVLHEEDAQAYNHARDPGMANHERSHARKFRKRAEIIRSALVPATSQARGSSDNG